MGETRRRLIAAQDGPCALGWWQSATAGARAAMTGKIRHEGGIVEGLSRTVQDTQRGGARLYACLQFLEALVRAARGITVEMGSGEGYNKSRAYEWHREPCNQW